MWLVKFLPEWAFTACIIIGALGLIATILVKYIPFIYRYLLPIQLFSIGLLLFGVYFSGAASNEAKWQAEARELKNQIMLAEERARSISSKIEYVFIDRIAKVKDVQIIVQEKLKDISVTIDSKCKVDPSAVELVNTAVKNIKPEEKK